MMMRFYKGWVYSLSSAVTPKKEGFYYYILNIQNKQKGYIHYGYDRWFEVGASSRIFLNFRNEKGIWKEKHIKIPFVKNGRRLEFDLPAYLKTLKISCKLYKRCDFYHGCDTNYGMIYCKNGTITYGSEWHIDYREEWMGIDLKCSQFKINGHSVAFMQEKLSASIINDRILLFLKYALKHPEANLSFAQLGKILNRIGIRKESCFFEIWYQDGTIITGDKIAWEESL